MTSDTRLERGSAALTDCDWETARSEFQAVVDEDAFPEAVSGWVRHAERALGGASDCVEAGWLELLRACFTSDPQVRSLHAQEAIDIGRRFGDPAVEFDGLAYLGKSLVEEGRPDDGLPLVDEAVAAVSSGLVTDPWAAAEILCTLFHACELAVDVRRAEGWLHAVDEHVDRTGERPTYGICRMHYGGLLTAAGRWADAERELSQVMAVYDAGYRGSRSEVLLRLADLRARQGRVEEADRLLAGYEDAPAAAAPRARLHLVLGDPQVARTVLQRYLDRRGRGAASVTELALLVEADLACGDIDAAERVAEELVALARAGGQPLVEGSARLSRARVAAARGQADAVGLYEEALSTFAGADLPCELAHSHLELAELLADPQPEVARGEARAALSCFERIGAAAGADAAAALLRELGDRSRSWRRPTGELTSRETQVLDLLAEGLQRRHRGAPARECQDGGAPRQQHPREAGRRQPDRGGGARGPLGTETLPRRPDAYDGTATRTLTFPSERMEARSWVDGTPTDGIPKHRTCRRTCRPSGTTSSRKRPRCPRGVPPGPSPPAHTSR